MLLKLVVMGLLVFITYLVITQTILPLLLGTKLFPAFRKSTVVEDTIETLESQHQEFDQIKYMNDLANELNTKINNITKESK